LNGTDESEFYNTQFTNTQQTSFLKPDFITDLSEAIKVSVHENRNDPENKFLVIQNLKRPIT